MPYKYMIIADETGKKQPAIHRGIELAKRSGVAVHLVAFVYDPYIAEEEDPQLVKKLKKTVVEERHKQIKEIIKTIDLADVKLTSEVIWEERISTWIIKHAKIKKYSMIIKTGQRTETVIHTPSDWQILRGSSVPVMIVAKKKWRKKNNILCSIDLGSENDEKKALNYEIVKQGKELARLLNGQLYCCYAIPVPTVLIDLDILDGKTLIKKRTKKAHAIFSKLADELELDKAILHTKVGKAEKVISSIANKLKVRMVVIGTVGRKGIKSKLLGNTAERVLQNLRTDLLAIKP